MPQLSSKDIDRNAPLSLYDAIHIMVDIETLGTSPGCAIVEIGMVCAEWTHYKGEWRWTSWSVPVALHADSQVDPITLQWWHADAGRTLHLNGLLNSDKRMHEEDAVKQLCKYLRGWVYESGKAVRLWSKGNFDFPILAHAITKHYPGEVPWAYWEVLDLRTMLAVAGTLGIQLPDRSEDCIVHSALGDARHQMSQLLTIIDHMCDSWRPSWI